MGYKTEERTARSAAATGWTVRELMMPRKSMDRYRAPKMLPTFWMVFLQGQGPMICCLTRMDYGNCEFQKHRAQGF